METEKQKVLKKIDELIIKRKNEMLKELPSIHEIDDGIVIRFFTDWDNCDDDSEIKFKKIVSHDNPNDSVVFFFLPKDSVFNLKQRFYIGNLICLNGKIDVTVNNQTRQLDGYSKISVDSNEVHGSTIENTYLITSSNKLEWSSETFNYVKHSYNM